METSVKVDSCFVWQYGNDPVSQRDLHKSQEIINPDRTKCNGSDIRNGNEVLESLKVCRFWNVVGNRLCVFSTIKMSQQLNVSLQIDRNRSKVTPSVSPVVILPGKSHSVTP